MIIQRLYLLPVEMITSNGTTGRGPKYFAWSKNPSGISCAWSMMDYGFMPSALLLAKNIVEADDTTLRSHTDVYTMPDVLDVAISGGDTIKTFCESINIPTDWTTPSTTYLQLLRCLAGIFQFAQRYGGISGGQALLSGNITLASRYRDLSTQQQTWFSETVTSFGYSPTIIRANSTFRQMLKLAGDAWGTQPFYLGGMAF